MEFKDIKSIDDLKKLDDKDFQKYMSEWSTQMTKLGNEKADFEDFKKYFDKYINIYEKIEKIKEESGIDGLFIALNDIISIIQIYYKHTEIKVKEVDKDV